MWIRDDITEAVRRVEANAVELSSEEARATAEKVESRFAKPGAGPLWERLQGCEGMQGSDVWRRIPDFVGGPALLLVEDAQGRCGFRFNISSDLHRVLAGCPGFDFYVTDDCAQYLLSFNHHDVLIGCGDAASWVRSLNDPTTPGEPDSASAEIENGESG
jgi:hypothetical protein